MIRATFVGFVLCACAACAPAANRLEGSARSLLAESVARGDVRIERIEMAPNPEQTIFGSIVEIAVKNVSSAPVSVVIEPGTILHGKPSSVTDLIITRPERATVAPGETWRQTLEVFSVNFHKFSLNPNVSYSFGNLADGDLKTLAVCVAASTRRADGKTNDSDGDKSDRPDLSPIQLAVWRISDGMSRDALLRLTGANPMLKGGQFRQSKEYFDRQAPYVQGTLDACGLKHYIF
jgi:hypothetical protein